MKPILALLTFLVFTEARATGWKVFHQDHTPNWTQECLQNQKTKGVLWHLCISTPKNSTNPDVLWTMPYGYDNEFFWLETRFGYVNRQLRKSFASSPQGAPRVVSLSFGPAKLLSMAGELQRDFLMTQEKVEIFFNTIVPAAEEKLGPFKGKRLGLGMSTGGFNLIQVINANKSWFDRIVLGFPMVPTIASPFDSHQKHLFAVDREIKKREVARTPWARDWDHLILMGVFYTIRTEYNPTEWKTTFREMLRPKSQKERENYPPMYVEVGTKDEMAYDRGTQRWFQSNTSTSPKAQHFLRINNGGHAQLDGDIAAAFFNGTPPPPQLPLRSYPAFLPYEGN